MFSKPLLIDACGLVGHIMLKSKRVTMIVMMVVLSTMNVTVAGVMEVHDSHHHNSVYHQFLHKALEGVFPPDCTIAKKKNKRDEINSLPIWNLD